MGVPFSCFVFVSFFIIVKIHSPAQYSKAFLLSDFLDKPWWPQVSSLPPSPVHAFTFIARRVQHSHFSFYARCSSNLLTHALALSARQLFDQKSPYSYEYVLRICTSTSMHLVKLEPMNLTFVGTNFTYHKYSIRDADIEYLEYRH